MADALDMLNGAFVTNNERGKKFLKATPEERQKIIQELQNEKEMQGPDDTGKKKYPLLEMLTEGQLQFLLAVQAETVQDFARQLEEWQSQHRGLERK
ncbi:MAG: hypothetical protein A2804_01340 [Candidatus Pacebacteria bacterium RIFCSPHIGHO2_01_FULL_46_10]|uniref:Uncharacterized protein n=1 Tax=Candidatus Gottesmanbacteria bacterium RIFCSPLOWO2_01_FULL_46_9 TaxID=1798394 RepID=A0A1F6B0E2_9BACT|nr:MAG: hypothetical protein A3A63_01875 [Candidatus Gottesmanbacteria bacterium RIFCSPLOWO2_01_FULL_46_9]OGJ21673.1 MAG: hypothetical protein A2804_01340 [Candidatus Pacebacteria bacterium RIFCSPHIGHO2_01_FULL_46_10]